MRSIKTSTSVTFALLLLVTYVPHSWSAPQKRNWTPQAILYLKGAQGHRSLSDRKQDGDTLHLVARSQNSDELSTSQVALALLKLFQQAKEKDTMNPEDHQVMVENQLLLIK